MRRRVYIPIAIIVILVLAAISYVSLNQSNPTVPGAPTQLRAVGGDGEVYLNWTAPAENGGSPIDYYTVYMDGGVATSTGLNISTIPALTNGVSYSFYVRAHNSAGLGAPSNSVSATPSAFVPSTGAVVSFINVGQGDSILIETSDSKHILIDAGPQSAAFYLIYFLQQESITTLDALIATHPDADHIGGADEVLAAFQVLRVYHPGLVKDTQAYTNFIAAVNAEDCPVYTDSQIDPGDMLPLSSTVTFQVLSIDANAPDSNSASIVLKMTYGTVDFIFEGDAPSSVENTIMANPIFNLDIEILKISHHGSSSSTSDAWLTETSPNIGAISVGPNSYGHPASDTLTRLSSHGVQVYRTDTDGTITISTNGTSWTVT